MDLELARTFLEVIDKGSFVGAAQRVHVTQSTVSTRIRLLEEQLGKQLFVRNKEGVALTPAGMQFQRHAAALVRIWQQARQDVAVPPGFRATVRIGGEAGLWNRWLHLWVPWMRQNAADIALRCEVGVPGGMNQALLEGLLDIGVMYSPHGRSGLKAVLVAEEELVMVESALASNRAAPNEQVYVDWGEEFRRQHRLAFPDFPIPALFIGLGTLGFDYLLHNGGAGYFPRSLIAPLLEAAAVRIVRDAPIFTLPIYAVHAVTADRQAIDPALKGLRAVIAQCPGLARPTARRTD